ncbi:MAG: DNA-binding protein [Desulfobacterales bacterium]|nr:DNA-binding protein [Desulfobacterales bacterium]
MIDNTNNDPFVCQCISDTLDGVRDGLSHFSGSSRVAVIYALTTESPVFICDPQNLLRGHEPKFRELYLDNSDWRLIIPSDPGKQDFGHMLPEKNLELAGLISYGGRSISMFYQMWFTEHHPDMCSIGPTERWLEHTAWRVSRDVANEKGLYTGISGSFLREYATHAVRDQIVDEMNVQLGWDSQIRVYPILDAILGISNTREEGASPRGNLLFIEPQFVESLEFLARIPNLEQPQLENYKHVRKLLQAVEHSDRMLVSDGRTIIGICKRVLPKFCITADFSGRHGFLKVNRNALCSFSDGSFKSTTHQAKLVQVEELLLESSLDLSTGNSIFKIIASLVHGAETEKHGCTLVVDLNSRPVPLSGHKLTQPLDLKLPHLLDLANSLSKVDGALHISSDMKLHGFACLLDGHSIPGEDHSRGARFNSALRFSAEHLNLFVVVVSADRPVAVIQEGIEISAQCQWKPVNSCIFEPEKLETWINSSGE